MIGLIVEESHACTLHSYGLVDLLTMIVARDKGVGAIIFQCDVFPIINVSRDCAVDVPFDSSSQPIILVVDGSGVWEINLDQLILRIPRIGGDLAGGDLGFSL